MKEHVETVTTDNVVSEVVKLKSEGYRFVTMSAVNLDDDKVAIYYHLELHLRLIHLRLEVSRSESDSKVPSISSVYFAALLIENEIQDQFGLWFEGLALDFGGHLLLEQEVTSLPFVRYSTVTKQ
ncbi:MAG: NADH-quinone oxidoreductase subunit C [Desulfovibrio sp.]|uniref:NADH-quinone oxidoreductase subunit C n=1 Tax=Desulfovibrio sp. 7SRBS1 TaxID=3378064 RepID=UPI003B3C0688